MESDGVRTGTHVWHNTINYTAQREIFRPCSTQCVTKILDIFKLFSSRKSVDEIVTETTNYAQQYKNSNGNILP
jgi:hypothetical protein